MPGPDSSRAVLHVATLGSGADLVLLHGWGLGSAVFASFGRTLARRFRVHLVDLPGYGASDHCEPYTLDVLVQCVARATPPRVYVVGWSLGAQLALAWARSARAQVARLGLIAATPCFTRRADWGCATGTGVFDAFARDLARDPQAVRERFLGLQAHGAERARAVLRALRAAAAHEPPPHPEALAGGLAILREQDLRAGIGAVAQPAAVIHGSRDELAPAAAGEWLAANLPHAHAAPIAGAGHAPFLSHPDETVQALARCFDD
ncbi:MAG TPA: alpha/beta fold hydrolase [Burkholderiales bacterium]|nr:alpha/beta fold hydrolase [Burkholderiales bacterium]